MNKFNLTKRKFSKPKKFSTTKIININAKENLTQSTKFYQKEIAQPFKILNKTNLSFQKKTHTHTHIQINKTLSLTKRLKD